MTKTIVSSMCIPEYQKAPPVYCVYNKMINTNAFLNTKVTCNIVGPKYLIDIMLQSPYFHISLNTSFFLPQTSCHTVKLELLRLWDSCSFCHVGNPVMIIHRPWLHFYAAFSDLLLFFKFVNKIQTYTVNTMFLNDKSAVIVNTGFHSKRPTTTGSQYLNFYFFNFINSYIPHVFQRWV